MTRAWQKILPKGREGMFDAQHGKIWTDYDGLIWTNFSNTSRTWSKVN